MSYFLRDYINKGLVFLTHIVQDILSFRFCIKIGSNTISPMSYSIKDFYLGILNIKKFLKSLEQYELFFCFKVTTSASITTNTFKRLLRTAA